MILGGRNFCRQCAVTYSPPQPAGVPGPAFGRALTRGAQTPFPDATWGVGEGVIIFFIAFILNIAFRLIFLRNLTDFFGSYETGYVVLMFVSGLVLYTLLFGGTIYSVKARHGGSIKTLGIRSEGTLRSLEWGFLLGIPLAAQGIAFSYMMRGLIPRSRDIISRIVSEFRSGDLGILVMLLFAVVLVVFASVFEEIFFRGYLYPSLRNQVNAHPAMIINAAIFAAFHFDLIGFLPRFIVGYGLCYAFEKSRNISGPILGHAMYNGLLLLVFGFLI